MITSVYSGYRKFCWPWWREILSPKTYWRWVKWTWQRGRRGYADCDVWSTDSYICSVVVPMLRQLKKARSYPAGSMPEGSDYTDYTEADSQRWQKEWDERLNTMIAGFEAAYAILDGPPDQFFTRDSKAPLGLHMDHDAVRKWEAEQEQIRLKGFEEFTKSFFNLWD